MHLHDKICIIATLSGKARIKFIPAGKGNQNSSGEYVSGKKLRQSPKIKVGKARSAVLEVSV